MNMTEIIRIRQEDGTGHQALSGELLVLSVLNILIQLSEIYKTRVCRLLYHNYTVFSINLTIAKVMHDTAYLAITY